MRKSLFLILIFAVSLVFPIVSYADGPTTTHGIFGDDMDDDDDIQLSIQNKIDPDKEALDHFCGQWKSMSKNDLSTITFTSDHQYTYTSNSLTAGYYNPLYYHGEYSIHGTKEKGSIEVAFDNGDYMTFQYLMYGIDEYLIDKKFYKKQKR